ncbi:unnamed protein product [Auanema sp. JU1783]|nr:unnamed protein product [Auanema sp. JU1783]
MWDNPIYFYAAVGYVVEIYSIFFIYVILTQSSKDIGLYKWAVLKLAISETFFSFVLINVVSPDVFIPPPAACCRGWLTSTQGTCKIGVMMSFMAPTICFASVNDCSFLRLFLLNNDQTKIDFFFSWKGGLLLLVVHVVLCAAIGSVTMLSMTDGKELRGYLDSMGGRNSLGSYVNATEYPVVAFLPTNIFYYITLLVLFVGFISFTTVNATIAYKCWRRINEGSRSMSKKTRNLQWNFTYMLIVQTVYPPIAICIPCMICCALLVFSSGLPDLSKLLLLTTLLILLYPLISASCCIYFIGPYKKYIMRITRIDRLLRRMNYSQNKNTLTQVSSISRENI